MVTLLKKTFKDFADDNCPRMAAAMAYYTVFALPPLFLLIILIAGAVVDPAKLQGAIQNQLSGVMGPRSAQQIQTMLASAHTSGGGGLTTVLSIIGVLFGATGIFVQLQGALNTAWEVEDEGPGGVKGFLMKRLLSAVMVVGAAGILLVTVIASAAISSFGGSFAGRVPGGPVMLQVVQVVVSVAIITALFAAIFKYVPDADVAWEDVWVGAAVTAVLFVAGKYLIGLYLARSHPGQAYGAAGSLALVLVFIYYASMILFLGAEFTQAWATAHGEGIRASSEAPVPG